MTSREKFVQYLKDEIESIQKETSESLMTIISSPKPLEQNNNSQIIIKNKHLDITEATKERYHNLKYLIKIMEIGDNEWEKINGVNDVTGILAEYIEKTTCLRLREKVELLMEEIEKNLEHGVENINHSILIDLRNVEEEGLTLKEVNEMMKDISIIDLIKKDEKELRLDEQKLKRIIKDSLDTYNQEELDDISAGYTLIKENYILKEKKVENGKLKRILTKKDIEKTVEGLLKIGVTSNFTSSIKYILEKELIKKQSSKSNITLHKENQKETKHFITDKEYKQIKKEILNYFNPYTGEVQKDLTEEEVFYCAQLMSKIDIDKDIIRTLFIKNDTQLENPIAEMVKIKDKIDYYQDKLMIEEHIKTIDESFQEIFITTPNDYVFWKDIIKQELKEVEHKLPQSYEYEMQKIKKLNNKSTKAH